MIKGNAIGKNINYAKLAPRDLHGFHALGITSIGQGRAKNQDALSVYSWCKNEQKKLILSVADGLGCYQFSERAAYQAVTEIPKKFPNANSFSEICFAFHKSLAEKAPFTVKGQIPSFLDTSQDTGATTFVSASIQNNTATIANIGDSRAYIVREGKIIYETKDQSAPELFKSRFKMGLEDSRDLQEGQFRNIILNALGSPDFDYEFEVDNHLTLLPIGTPIIDTLSLKKNDLILLTTDGAHTNLTHQQLFAFDSLGALNAIADGLEKAIDGAMKTGLTNDKNKSVKDNFSFLLYRH